MGFFDKIKGAIGIGQPKLEVIPSPNPVKQGSILTVKIKLTGGTRELEVAAIHVRFFQKSKTQNEQGTEYFDKAELAEQVLKLNNYKLKPNELWQGDVQFELPEDLELSGPDFKYEVSAQVDVPGLDPRKTVDLTVVDENGQTADGESQENEEAESESESETPAEPSGIASAGAAVSDKQETAPDVEQEAEEETRYSLSERVGFLRDYMERFDRMVEEMRANDRIVVINYHRFPGLENDEIADIETDAGFKISRPMKEFYRQSNGLQLIWIDKEEEGYSPSEHVPSDKPKAWDHAQYDYWPYTGMVMIRPLEEAVSNFPYSLDHADNEYEVEYRGETLGDATFQEQVRVFDEFNKYYDGAWIIREDGDHDVILGRDHQACWTDSSITDFDSYLELLLAQKGMVSARNDFMNDYNGVGKGLEKKAYKPYWEERGLSLNNLFNSDIFPEADQTATGLPVKQDDTGIRLAKGETIPQTEFMQITGSHRQWRNSGGYVRSWEVLEVKPGLNLAVPRKVEGEKGEQAELVRKDLSENRSKGVNLSHANLMSVYAPGQDFSNANLSGTCLTDSWLPMANFSGADLKGADFSRSNLKGANFSGANLDQCDFENCDLTGADFTGCNTTTAKFSGARLNDVKQNIDSPDNPFFRNDTLRLIQLLQKAGVDFIMMEKPKKGSTPNILVRPEEENVRKLIDIVNEYGESHGWYDHTDWVDTILNEDFESMGSSYIGFAKNKYEEAKSQAEETEMEGLKFAYHPDYWGLLAK